MSKDKEKKGGLFGGLKGLGIGSKSKKDEAGGKLSKCFGVPLASLVSAQSDIPSVLRKALEFLDTEAFLGLEGMFRTVPSMADVQKLQRLFEENDHEFLSLSGSDPHAVGGLLKRFFRELPEPVFTNELYDKWTAAQSLPTKDEQIREMMQLFQKLPVVNRSALRALFRFLNKLLQYSASNKLTSTVLGVVWQPNLVWSSAPGHSSLDSLKMGMDGTMMGLVVSLMVENFSVFFADMPEAPAQQQQQQQQPSQPTQLSGDEQHQSWDSMSSSEGAETAGTSPAGFKGSLAELIRTQPQTQTMGAGAGQNAYGMSGDDSAPISPRGSGGTSGMPGAGAPLPPSNPPPPGPPKLTVQIPSMNMGAPTPSTTPGSGPSTPSSQASTPKTPAPPPSANAKRQLVLMNGYSQGVAMCDYNETDEGRLQFVKNDLIWITHKHADGWWEGWKRGVRGFFPAAYVYENYS